MPYIVPAHACHRLRAENYLCENRGQNGRASEAMAREVLGSDTRFDRVTNRGVAGPSHRDGW